MRNLKKVIALVAVFAMLVSTVAFAATFDDVAETDTYSQAIETLNQLGILTGDDANNDGVMSFRPNDTITRAEITAIIARMQGRTGEVAQTETIFKDVPATHWASGYIQSATSTQIINGYGDGNFGPDDNVLYQDVVKMIMETLGYKNYALENGGYPVGYEIAAQRQKVLDGVIGGADGVEATRGMVAQMVDNAIEAPLMDRMAYGGNGQYVIYDGTWQPMRTCLSEYLGVTKLSGQVISNGITALDGPQGINTLRDETVNIRIKDLFKVQSNKYVIPSVVYSDDDYNYYSFYVGNTNAAEYFGYNVTAYARINGNTDYDTLISIVPTEGQNSMASFNLSQFSYYDNDESNVSGAKPALYYMRNENDRSPQRLAIDPNGAYVVYNGICGYTMDRVFAPQGGATTGGRNQPMVTADSTYSGQVTLIDNNNTAGYDFIFVDIAVGAVVEELSNRGVLTFKNTPGEADKDNSIRRVEFESTTNNAYIKITKDGQPYDYTQLKEWDVLSIVANTANDSDQYYDIEVLNGESTAIAGTVDRVEASDTSDGGSAYRINGTTYDLAAGAYTPSTIRAGSSGTFYVDKYGKIVAYNRDLNATSGTSSNYAYILNAEITSGTFGEISPVLQFVYRDGSVNTASFAQNVTIYNPSSEFLAAGATDTDYVTYKYKDDADVSTAIQSLVGKVVTLSASGGMIRSMTMPFNDATTGVEKDSTLAVLADGSIQAPSFEYDQDTQEMRIQTNEGNKRIDVTPDTTVFFIGRPGDGFIPGQSAAGLPTEDCTVSTGANLVTMNMNQPAIAYSNGNVDGSADVIVLFNSDIATSPDAGVAMVTSVGTGSNGTLSVSYYQNGELIQAQTSEDFTDTDLTEKTLPGSLFKFGKTGDYITSATPYLTFNGDQIRADVSSGDVENGIPQVAQLYGGAKDEEISFGAVVGRNGNRIRIATMKGELGSDGYYEILPTPGAIESVSLNNVQANYYVYDAARNSRSRIGLGGISDIYVDRYLAGNDGVSTGDKITLGTFHGDNPVFGLLDYVYIRTYERTGDVVLYMQRQYDYTID